MVNFLCLPPREWKPETNEVCMIAGWGLHSGVDNNDEHGKRMKNRKRFSDSKLALIRSYDKDECQCSFSKHQK